MKKYLSYSICFRLVVICFFIYFSSCADKNAYKPPPLPEVTISQPIKHKVMSYLDFSGYTKASLTIEIRARVQGYLQTKNYKSGSKVTKGDLLFTIDPRPYEDALDEAKAQLLTAKANLKLTSNTLKMMEDALVTHAVSELDVIQARAQKEEAVASVASAEAQIRTAKLNLSYCWVRAPITGRISINLVDVGNLVGAGESTQLATLVQDDPMYVYFNVGEKDLLSELSPSNVISNPDFGIFYVRLNEGKGFPYTGTLKYQDPIVDLSTGTVTFMGEIPNKDGSLLSGLYVKIRLPTRSDTNALLIVEEALNADQGGHYLLIVGEGDTVSHHNVTLGADYGEFRLVKDGITEDDWVIIKGLQKARPGIKVKTIKEPIQITDTIFRLSNKSISL